MIRQLSKSLFILSLLSLYACKSDPKDTETENAKPIVEQPSESQKHLQNIERAHNSAKFKEENQVRFNLKLSTEDDVFFDGAVTLKTDGSKARFLDSGIDQTIKSDDLSNEIDKKLYHLAELYCIGFWLQEDNFSKTSSVSEDFVQAVYDSPETSSTFTVFSHPLTDIIQHLQYKTDIDAYPFDEATVFFDKYITVNRIPVALNWYFTKAKDTIARAQITRISYPETF